MEGIRERERERKKRVKVLHTVCDGLNNFSHPVQTLIEMCLLFLPRFAISVMAGIGTGPIIALA